MKIIKWICLLSFIILASCSTVTSTEQAGGLIQNNDTPDPESAYFLIITEGRNGIQKTAIIVEDSNKNQTSILSGKDEMTQLIKVKPETYSNDFVDMHGIWYIGQKQDPIK